MKRVIVCGAGTGGMVSAIYLAHKGYEVKIFEMNEKPGGKMGQLEKDGYRFDTGPSLITLPEIFRNFFKDISRNIEDYIQLIPLDISCKYFWNDGTVFSSFNKEDKLSKELKDVFGEEGRNNYYRYLDYGKLFYQISKDKFLEDEFRIRNFITAEGIKNFTKFISGRSLNDVSNKFFKDPKLKQLMDRYATYNGSSPYLTPQFFSIIPYIENKFGSYKVKGGIYKITESLEKLCKEFNIGINYNTKVTGFETSGKNIRKIFTETSGQKTESEINFDIVVSNYTNSVELTGKEYFENDDWSSSGFVMYLGIDRSFPELSHHNILYSEDYENEFIEIFEMRIPPEDMTVYISISKKDNPEDAPDGCENWFVLVNVPSIRSKDEWTEEKVNGYKTKIFNKIDSFNFLFTDSIRNHIKFCEVFTPEDFLSKYNSEKGSIYGLSSNSLYTLMKRPKNKSSRYDNLYFTGGNTHPGGGVPLCFLSGKIVSRIIT